MNKIGKLNKNDKYYYDAGYSAGIDDEEHKVLDSGFQNKVKKRGFEFEEDVKDFTGLIFHCPNCDEVFHLHIATVRVKEKENE